MPWRIGRKRPSTPSTMKIQPKVRIAIRESRERRGLSVALGGFAPAVRCGPSDMDRPVVDGECRLLYRLVQGWVPVANAGDVFRGTAEFNHRYNFVD